MGEEYIRLKEMTFDVNVASANADSPFGVVPPRTTRMACTMEASETSRKRAGGILVLNKNYEFMRYHIC